MPQAHSFIQPSSYHAVKLSFSHTNFILSVAGVAILALKENWGGGVKMAEE